MNANEVLQGLARAGIALGLQSGLLVWERLRPKCRPTIGKSFRVHTGLFQQPGREGDS